MSEAPTNGEWQRRGECNGCGWCCQFIGHQVWKFTPQPPPGESEVDRHFMAVRGIALIEGGQKGAVRVDLFAPCKVHDLAGKRCLIYDQRPITCRVFPERPEQIRGTPCSYWFERQVGGQIETFGGNGAPDNVSRG